MEFRVIRVTSVITQYSSRSILLDLASSMCHLCHFLFWYIMYAEEGSAMDQGKLLSDFINHMTLYSHCPENYINYMPKELKEFVIRIREETKYLIHITSDANKLILHELLAYIVYNNHNNITFTVGPNMAIGLKQWPGHTVGDLIRSLEAIKNAIDKSK